MREPAKLRKLSVTGARAVVAVLLAGCGRPPAPDTAPTAATLTATAPAADGGTYGSAVELRDAVVEAGVDCPKWDEHNRNKLAATYGHIRLGRALESRWPSGRSSGLSPEAWRVVFKVSAP